MSEGALTSFTIYDAYGYFSGQAWLMTSQSRPRTEYLLQIVLELYLFRQRNLM